MKPLHSCRGSSHDIGQPSTDMEVAKFFNKTDPNYIRPRRNELAETDKEKRLLNKPLIQYSGIKRKCKVTGMTCMTWWFTDLGKTLFDMDVF